MGVVSITKGMQSVNCAINSMTLSDRYVSDRYVSVDLPFVSKLDRELMVSSVVVQPLTQSTIYYVSDVYLNDSSYDFGSTIKVLSEPCLPYKYLVETAEPGHYLAIGVLNDDDDFEPLDFSKCLPIVFVQPNNEHKQLEYYLGDNHQSQYKQRCSSRDSPCR